MKAGVWWPLLAVMAAVAGLVLWQGRQAPQPGASLPLSSSGMAAVELANTRGCLVCHSLDGSAGIGPSWAGSYGSARVLHDGSSVVMDEAYLRRAMQEPAAQVLAGFDNVMVPANLSDSETELLMGLIRELAAETSP